MKLLRYLCISDWFVLRFIAASIIIIVPCTVILCISTVIVSIVMWDIVNLAMVLYGLGQDTVVLCGYRAVLLLGVVIAGGLSRE